MATPSTRLARRRRSLLVGILVVVGFYLLAFTPTRTYVDQKRQMHQAQERYELLSVANKELDKRATLLETDAEIARLAREKYELVPPGTKAYAVMPPTPGPAIPSTKQENKSLWEKVLDGVSFWN